MQVRYGKVKKLKTFMNMNKLHSYIVSRYCIIVDHRFVTLCRKKCVITFRQTEDFIIKLEHHVVLRLSNICDCEASVT